MTQALWYADVLLDAGGGGPSTTDPDESDGKLIIVLPEPGSAQWHAHFLSKALEKEACRLGSSKKGSQLGVGSSGSSSRGASRDSTSFNPRLGSAHHRSVRKGYALASLQNLHSAELGRIVLPDKVPHTARGAMQTTEPHSPRGSSKRYSPQAGRPNTSANPREQRIKQWQLMEMESRGSSRDTRDSVRFMSSDDNNKEEMVRPMTQSDKRQMVRTSLQGFQRYFDQNPLTKVGEVPGPSMVQSVSVNAYIQMDDSDMSDVELLHKLSQRSTAPRLKIPPTQRLNFARRAERLNQDRKEHKGAGLAWGGPKRPSLNKVASDGSEPVQARQFVPEFKSTGLFAHTELERLRTVDESRKNPEPDKSRVAQCCSLLERLQVKYFDEELSMLKQELFRAIFHDVETLKQLPEPRSREAFLGAKPYFQLWQAQNEKVEELEMSIKTYQAEAQNAIEMHHQLESRLRLFTGGGGGGDGGGLGGGTNGKGQGLQGEASDSESMLRSSVPSVHRAAPHRTTPPNSATPLSKVAHLNTASHSRSLSLKGEPSTTWPIYDGGATAATTPPPSGRTQHGASTPRTSMGSIINGPSTSMRSILKPANVPAAFLSPMRSLTHTSLNATSTATPASARGGAGAGALAGPGEWQGSGKQANPFVTAMSSVKLVASEIDNLETYLRLYRDSLTVTVDPQAPSVASTAAWEGGDGAVAEDGARALVHEHCVKPDQEIDTEVDGERSVAPKGHTLVMGHKLRRRKRDFEARWRDFAIYLSRHPESCLTDTEKLQEFYDKWRMTFEYKAPFSCMLRALVRHKQVSVLGPVSNHISYSSDLGVDMGLSSDDEEDLEAAIVTRDTTIAKLQMSKMQVEHQLEHVLQTHAQTFDRRMSELEAHSDRMLHTAQTQFDTKILSAHDKVEELHEHLAVKEAELKKVQYLLQDGDSLAAVTNKLKEDLTTSATRFERREKQLLEQSAKDQDTIATLRKHLDVAEMIQKTGREREKIKVGFSTQRALITEQAKHQGQVLELERAFQDRLELAHLKGNLALLTVPIRFLSPVCVSVSVFRDRVSGESEARPRSRQDPAHLPRPIPLPCIAS